MAEAILEPKQRIGSEPKVEPYWGSNYVLRMGPQRDTVNPYSYEERCRFEVLHFNGEGSLDRAKKIALDAAMRGRSCRIVREDVYKEGTFKSVVYEARTRSTASAGGEEKCGCVWVWDAEHGVHPIGNCTYNWVDGGHVFRVLFFPHEVQYATVDDGIDALGIGKEVNG